jgi:predicted secreted protein
MPVTVAVITAGKSKPEVAGVFTSPFEEWVTAYYKAGGFEGIEIFHTRGYTVVYYDKDNQDKQDTWDLFVHYVDDEIQSW